MRHARPNAVSLAVAFAISSSIIVTQALADRRLQIKSIDIGGNGHKEFTQSEVVIQPTLGQDQQPIPKSFTTTYSYKPQESKDSALPSIGFTEVLYGINGDVSSVDQFETSEDGIAQKYTKVLKVGDEGFFRFTHNLEEKELVIEVRGGMTDQDSVKAVRDQLVGIQSLEPSTKIANPVQLAFLLEGVGDRAGNLGASDHYVPLATIEVEKVEVNGRTFMRLIASGDQPPALQRLGQSLFVNDEALLAAATSAYVQVHVLEGDIQQQALNDLLAHSKPVGYVVHVEDDTQVYPVPEGYPKLEVAEASGEVIVFHGQNPNPHDIAFVENLHKLWLEAGENNPAAAATRVKKHKVKGYQFAIRSRQMALLEEFVARHDAGAGKDQPTTLTDQDKLAVHALSYYEFLQQALSSAMPAQAVEFEFTPEHVRASSTVITPTWLQIQLAKHFSFKPALKDLLINQNFVNGIMSHIPVVDESQLDVFNHDEQFAAKVVSDTARQMVEWERQLQEHLVKKSELIRVKNHLELVSETANASEKEKLRALQLKQQAGDKLALIRKVAKELEEQSQKLQYEVERIPYLQRQLLDAREEASIAHNTQLAEVLGIDNWDGTQPAEEQVRLIRKNIHEMHQSVAATFAATGQPGPEAIKAKLAAIEDRLGITPVDENDLVARCQSIQHYQHQHQQLQQHLQQKTEMTDAGIHKLLTRIQHRLSLDQDIEKGPEVRSRAIRKHPKQQAAQAGQERFQQQSIKKDTKDRAEKIKTMNVKQEIADLSELNEGIATEDINVLKSTIHTTLLKNAALEEQLKDINTPGQSKALPEVFETLRAMEKALGDKTHINERDDVYLNRQLVSEDIRLYVSEARLRQEAQVSIILQLLEDRLGIRVRISESDGKAGKLARVRARLDSGDVSNDQLADMDRLLRVATYRPAPEGSPMQVDVSLSGIHDLLKSLNEESDQRARIRQAIYLIDLEVALNIFHLEYPAAKERGKNFIAKLASDLQIGFADDANLFDQQHALRDRIQELMKEVNETYDDEGVKRIRNNQMADQLEIRDFRVDAGIDEQNSLIKAKLEHLDEEVFKAGQPEVDERIAAIENELDRQMARLGPKPRFVLDRDAATARGAIKNAENELAAIHRNLKELRGEHLIFAGNRADLQHIPDKENAALNQRMKEAQIELGLAASDKQTTEERLKDIRHFLLECSAEKRDEILEELGIKSGLNIQITGDTGLEEASDYLIAIARYADSDAQNKFSEGLGKLLYNRKKYAQLRDLLREHDRKSMNVANAMTEEALAQADMIRKQKEIEFGTSDELIKALPNLEIAQLSLALSRKSEALSNAKQDLADHNALLEATEKAMGLKPAPADTHEQRLNALRNRQVQIGGNDGYGGTVRHLIQEQTHLQDNIEYRKKDIERMKGVLKAAEQAVESDPGPFQYTPKQVQVLNTIHEFTQQHPLKKQALEAAIGLREAAVASGKQTLLLPTLHFDDGFAAIRLQAQIGDKLTFEQASRMVEAFKSLKVFPESTLEPIADRPQSALSHVLTLSLWAIYQTEKGPQQYDDLIRGMGKTFIHFVEHEQGGLKGFPEYFASHSASGYNIITLLREGLISKVELEHYLKAVRGVGVYTAMGEFEHFIGSKHGVHVPQFRKLVQMLSDKGAEEFMQSAFIPVTVTATGPTGMKESVAGMKEYAAAVIANYVLDDIAFDNGRRTAAFLANIQDTLTRYANAAGLSESELIKAIHDTLMQTHAAAVEWQLNDYWVKPSAFLVQAVTWYYSSYKPLLAITNARNAAKLSLSGMVFLYLLDLTNRGDYTHRILTPFQHWLEHYGVDLDRTHQYACHDGIEQVSEVGGLAMPLGKAASSVILLRMGSVLFARQHHANPQMYRSISRLVPEIVKSMGSGQGVQVPLLHRVTPQKVKTLASATAGLVLGPVATVGAYAHGLISGFTYAQTFGFALASSLTFDFFMNDNKMLTQWLGGPLGRSLDKINRWRGVGETQDDYVKRTAIASPQRFNETDEAYTNRVKASDATHGWTRYENYLQFRERRDRTMKMFENSWEQYFRDNVPRWSFSHAESIPYSYTLGALFESRAIAAEENPAAVKAAPAGLKVEKLHLDKDKNTHDEL